MITFKSVLRVVPAVVGALYYGGCYMPPAPHDEFDVPAPTVLSPRLGGYGSPTMSEVSMGGVMQGSMGNIQQFAGNAVETHVSSGASYSTVQLDALSPTPQWWAMARLTFAASLSNPALRPGAQLVFDNHSASNPANFGLTVVGCSGPTRGNYTFDQHADHVVVNVMPGPTPATRRMAFTAVFASSAHGTQTITGEFEYTPS